jgi:hypothetical protein
MVEKGKKKDKVFFNQMFYLYTAKNPYNYLSIFF